MSYLDNEKIAANYMGAIAHALGGSPGRQREFIEKVELVLSDLEPDALLLMQFSECVRSVGRPVIWIHHPVYAPTIPLIGLVALIEGQVRMIENCVLWMPKGQGRLQLVPDSFFFGTYGFDDELRLRHMPKAPAKTFEAAKPGMKRAYDRVLRIEAQQLERGDTFALPTYRPLGRAA